MGQYSKLIKIISTQIFSSSLSLKMPGVQKQEGLDVREYSMNVPWQCSVVAHGEIDFYFVMDYFRGTFQLTQPNESLLYIPTK